MSRRSLRLAAVSACAGLALSGGAAARTPHTAVGSMRTQAVLWSGSVSLLACPRNPAASSVGNGPASGLTPALHAPGRERHGELVGELLGAPDAGTAAAAEHCAARAAADNRLLHDGQDLRRFHTAFLICLHESHASDAIGALTLWVDNSCDW